MGSVEFLTMDLVPAPRKRVVQVRPTDFDISAGGLSRLLDVCNEGGGKGFLGLSDVGCVIFTPGTLDWFYTASPQPRYQRHWHA